MKLFLKIVVCVYILISFVIGMIFWKRSECSFMEMFGSVSFGVLGFLFLE